MPAKIIAGRIIFIPSIYFGNLILFLFASLNTSINFAVFDLTAESSQYPPVTVMAVEIILL
jgi:hypothetical protein